MIADQVVKLLGQLGWLRIAGGRSPSAWRGHCCSGREVAMTDSTDVEPFNVDKYNKNLSVAENLMYKRIW